MRAVLVSGALAMAGAIAFVPPATAQSLSVKAGTLADALRELSLRTRTGILFSPELVAGMRNRDLSRAANLDDALSRLLAGSGLTYQWTASGTVIIVRAPNTTGAPTIPEILVVGSRLQNEDIRRSGNDIQPYRVLTQRDFRASGDSGVNDVLRTQLTNVTGGLAPWQDPLAGSGTNRSAVNLQGLGADQTLVLVDGNRMPGVPSNGPGLILYQSDLNGLPLSAIERIETLTATSGGIYGPGAVGGTINVVLKRDYRGAAMGLSYGLTDRGDAAYRRMDGRVGFSPDAGRTDIMLAFSKSKTGQLEAGSRSFALGSLALNARIDPNYPVNGAPPLNALVVVQPSGLLSLNSALGGSELGSSYTYVPLTYRGVAMDGKATLLANAGTFPLMLSEDANGTGRSLTNGARTSSIIASLRQRSVPGVDFLLDAIAYRTKGSATQGGNTGAFLDAGAANNPFGQTVLIYFPLPGLQTTARSSLTVLRASAGVIIRLPRSWSAVARYTFGYAANKVETTGTTLSDEYPDAIRDGLPSPTGRPALNPFGNGAAFQSAIQAYLIEGQARAARSTQTQDASIRLAGTLLKSLAGPTTISILAERRRDRVPETSSTQYINFPVLRLYHFNQTVSTLYGELRSPLLPGGEGWRPIRGLELQFALRYDGSKSSIPIKASSTTDEVGRYEASFGAVAYTAGFRAFPLDRLMVRASIASGVLPPTPAQLFQQRTESFQTLIDPRRNGARIGVIDLLSYGSPTLRPERANSLGVGLVWDPDGGRLPRISIDYTRIAKRDEISLLHNFDVSYFLANEAVFPRRVVRAPLSQADRDAGYAVGRVTLVDTSAQNVGRAILQTVDLRADCTVDLKTGGELRLTGAMTWAPSFVRRLEDGQPRIRYTGFADGPLRWRGNASTEWIRGRLSLDLSAQFYDAYRGIDADTHIGGYDPVRDVRVPPQAYVNLFGSYRFDLPRIVSRTTNLELAVAVENLFGRVPPVAINNDVGYSPYGDPRGRRFSATVSARF